VPFEQRRTYFDLKRPDPFRHIRLHGSKFARRTRDAAASGDYQECGKIGKFQRGTRSLKEMATFKTNHLSGTLAALIVPVQMSHAGSSATGAVRAGSS